jgi:hypothetical protein
MANRSNVMGLHGLKNKTSRNSFDLSHRNLFTAKVGELLPCFVQEVNPGDSLKLDSSYFTRTAPLQTAAFTRLRENVQYFFVPYQCLWKYFESQVRNMTKNAAGGDISMIAKSPFQNAKQTTDMPYISYSALHEYLNNLMYVNDDNPSESSYPNRYNNGTLRHCESAKLLQLLGYGNFSQQFNSLSKTKYSLKSCLNPPALSVFRILAYQKVCNDFYTYQQWQPYNASLANIDYVTPDSNNMNVGLSFSGGMSEKDLNKMNMLDMRFSNLPLDYFNGVLPVAQFGSDSVVNLKGNFSARTGDDYGDWSTGNSQIPTKNATVVTNPNNGQSLYANGNILKHTHAIGSSDVNSTLSVFALRQATALQK